MMQLLKFINIGMLIFAIIGCANNTVKSTVDANVESRIIEIPDQAAKDFKLAIALMNESKFDEALLSFEAMTEKYPELSGPYANLGVIYSKNEKWQEAKAVLELSVERNPSNIKALNQLGLVLRHLGEFKQAEKHYLNAIKLAPNTPDSYLNLGILYDIYMGKFIEAGECYQKYQTLQAEPNRQVTGWIVDINRRVGNKTQIAGDTQ